MKEIQLSQGKLAFVDDEDFEPLLKLGRWSYSENRRGGNGYADNEKEGGMHRCVMLMHGHDLIEKVVDHVDRNGLNNQKNNLRVCNDTQNKANRRVDKANKSGYRGVRFDPRINRWTAKIIVNGKSRSAGSYEDARTAAIARDILAKRVRGDYAAINVPDATVEETQRITHLLDNPKFRQKRKSRFHGVSTTKTGKWRCYVSIKRGQQNIGTFDNETMAAKIRDYYVIKLNLPLPRNFSTIDLEAVKAFLTSVPLGHGRYSDFRGVSFCKRDKRFLAQIKKQGVFYNLGRFNNDIEAARAYNAKAVELFGDNAVLNVIP